MGIPYSREINAAFEQVTPLVAAGFKVLKTTKNISILLAVIQVLTVLFLAMILMVLLGIAYAINPDLEKERKEMVTPIFKGLARISFLGMIETIAASVVGFGGFLGISFLFLHRRDLNSLEKEGEDDADEALEGLSDEDKKKAKEGKEAAKKENAKQKKKNEEPVDGVK